METSFGQYRPLSPLSEMRRVHDFHVNPPLARVSAITSYVAAALAAVALFFGVLFQSPLLLVGGCVCAVIAWWKYPSEPLALPPRNVPQPPRNPEAHRNRIPNQYVPPANAPEYPPYLGAGPSSLPPMYSPPREIPSQRFGAFMQSPNVNSNQVPPPVYQAPHAREVRSHASVAEGHISIDPYHQGTPPPLASRASRGAPAAFADRSIPPIPNGTQERSRVAPDAQRVVITPAHAEVAPPPAASRHAPVFVADRPAQASFFAPSAPYMQHPAPASSTQERSRIPADAQRIVITPAHAEVMPPPTTARHAPVFGPERPAQAPVFAPSAPYMQHPASASSTQERSRIPADAQRVVIDQDHQGTPEDPRHRTNLRSTATRSRVAD